MQRVSVKDEFLEKRAGKKKHRENTPERIYFPGIFCIVGILKHAAETGNFLLRKKGD